MLSYYPSKQSSELSAPWDGVPAGPGGISFPGPAEANASAQNPAVSRHSQQQHGSGTETALAAVTQFHRAVANAGRPGLARVG